MSELEDRLRPVIKRSTGAKPLIYAIQRHYTSQRSPAETDARLEVDLRTIRQKSGSNVKYQPQWIDAIYELLTHKRSNIQFGVEVRFRYDCPIIRSQKAVSLFAEAWIAMRPLLDLVLNE